MTASRHIDLGLQQMRLGNPRGAVPHFKAALAEDPDDALVHAYAALCLIDMGLPDAAARMANTAAALAPDEAYIHLVAGIVALARMNHETAEKHLEEARRLDQSLPDVYRWLGELYERTGRRKNVVAVLEEGLTHDPRNIRLIARLGQHYFAAGRIAEAEELARQALAIAPEFEGAHVLHGQVELRRGNAAAALDHALLALRQDPTDDDALRLLCAVKANGNPIVARWWRIAAKLERMGSGMPLYSFLLMFLIGFLVLARALIGAGLFLVAVALLVPAAAVFAGAIYGAWRIRQILKPGTGKVTLKKDF
jgi:tetratricopeptide (TPR) repeat protein